MLRCRLLPAPSAEAAWIIVRFAVQLGAKIGFSVVQVGCPFSEVSCNLQVQNSGDNVWLLVDLHQESPRRELPLPQRLVGEQQSFR